MGKLRYTDLKQNPKALLAHTGLKPDEFEALAVFFDQAWRHYIEHYTLEGKPRARQSRGRKNETFATVEDRLLFVLIYLKTNPLQEVLAAAFGLRQPHGSAWLKVLLPILERALDKADALPERTGERLARAVADKKKVLIDGTERPIQRPIDDETQREYYSGKKKRHTIKNVVLAAADKRVLYLSQTYEGPVSDKRVADEEALDFGTRDPELDEVLLLLQDLGFQGYAPAGVVVVQPMKKPRGGKLTAEQKASNRAISSQRVVVEHAIGGVKIWRIVKEVIRSWCHRLRDQVMYLACGLHNFRLACRAGPIQN
ncbi:MAG: transposase family protein [Gemmatimonadetes bacterium]|nr:transposase family protein [Gemmatimonadota bacterium]